MLSHLFDIAVHVLGIGALVFIGLAVIGLFIERYERKHGLKAAGSPDQPELPIERPKPQPQIVINHKAKVQPVRTQLELPAPPVRAIASVPNLALERSVRRLPDDAA